MTETVENAARVDRRPPRDQSRRPRVHRAWIVAAVTFVTIIGGAAFNSLPGLLINPLHTEFGWS
ncbi:MFS transporter, partial [Streptomyces sp. SID7499]|nr:MFS transporter [Streptomyces sp. SID7499]